MSLASNLRDSGNACRPAIRFISDYDFEPVRRKLRRDSPEIPAKEIDSGIEQLRRYYALTVLEPDRAHAVSKPLDVYWHAHILFSRDYERFCKRAFGAMLEHEPFDPDDKEMATRLDAVYRATLESQMRHFVDVEKTWWPPADSPDVLICLGKTKSPVREGGMS